MVEGVKGKVSWIVHSRTKGRERSKEQCWGGD